MLITIHTDTFEDSQKLYDLCSMAGLSTWAFINVDDVKGEGSMFGCDITVRHLDERFTVEKIIRFVFEHFGEKSDYAEIN